MLLREDGTSVAFPEAVEQARDDMQQIAERLRPRKVDMITQGLEEDVIAALEEIAGDAAAAARGAPRAARASSSRAAAARRASSRWWTNWPSCV